MLDTRTILWHARALHVVYGKTHFAFHAMLHTLGRLQSYVLVVLWIIVFYSVTYVAIIVKILQSITLLTVLCTVRLAFWNEISNKFSVEYESYMHELPDHLLVSTFFGAPIEFFNCNEL